eukprot:3860415-Ditylum_brightwellii.AAC.1
MAHKVVGEGYMKIPNGNGICSNTLMAHPTMPITIISPEEVVQRHKKLYKSNTIYCDEDEQLGY